MKYKVGDEIILNKTIGKFKKGTKMKIISLNSSGWDLSDKEGNTLENYLILGSNVLTKI